MLRWEFELNRRMFSAAMRCEPVQYIFKKASVRQSGGLYEEGLNAEKTYGKNLVTLSPLKS
jgi:hypothetical protein